MTFTSPALLQWWSSWNGGLKFENLSYCRCCFPLMMGINGLKNYWLSLNFVKFFSWNWHFTKSDFLVSGFSKQSLYLVKNTRISKWNLSLSADWELKTQINKFTQFSSFSRNLDFLMIFDIVCFWSYSYCPSRWQFFSHF